MQDAATTPADGAGVIAVGLGPSADHPLPLPMIIYACQPERLRSATCSGGARAC